MYVHQQKMCNCGGWEVQELGAHLVSTLCYEIRWQKAGQERSQPTLIASKFNLRNYLTLRRSSVHLWGRAPVTLTSLAPIENPVALRVESPTLELWDHTKLSLFLEYMLS